jgi:hypothetical protein
MASAAAANAGEHQRRANVSPSPGKGMPPEAQPRVACGPRIGLQCDSSRRRTQLEDAGLVDRRASLRDASQPRFVSGTFTCFERRTDGLPATSGRAQSTAATARILADWEQLLGHFRPAGSPQIRCPNLKCPAMSSMTARGSRWLGRAKVVYPSFSFALSFPSGASI